MPPMWLQIPYSSYKGRILIIFRRDSLLVDSTPVLEQEPACIPPVGTARSALPPRRCWLADRDPSGSRFCCGVPVPCAVSCSCVDRHASGVEKGSRSSPAVGKSTTVASLPPLLQSYWKRLRWMTRTGGKRCTARDLVLLLRRRQPGQMGLLSPSSGSSLVKARRQSSRVHLAWEDLVLHPGKSLKMGKASRTQGAQGEGLRGHEVFLFEWRGGMLSCALGIGSCPTK